RGAGPSPRRGTAGDLRRGGAGTDRRRGRAAADARGRRHGDLVPLDLAPEPPRGPRRTAPGLDLYHPGGAPRLRGAPPAPPPRGPARKAPAPPKDGAGGRHRPGCLREKPLIEDAYRLGEAMGLAVWCTDQAGPYQTTPYASQSWRPEGDPGRLPHE